MSQYYGLLRKTGRKGRKRVKGRSLFSTGDAEEWTWEDSSRDKPNLL